GTQTCALPICHRNQLAGLIITHAHEDHVGAVPYLWSKLRCPVYCTRFTAEVLKKRLVEHGLLHRVKIIVPETGERLQIGTFNVRSEERRVGKERSRRETETHGEKR